MKVRLIQFLVCTGMMVLFTGVTVAGDLPEDFLKDEATFLQYAGPEWTVVADGVYERRKKDGGVQRIGFGLSSFEYYLDKALMKQAALNQRARDGEKSDELMKELKGNAAFIAHLQAGLEDGYSQKVSDQACNGTYTLNPMVGLTFVDGWAQATASWSEFGPVAPYNKNFYVSARATNTSVSPPDSAYDYASDTVSSTCCFNINSGQVWAYLTWSCELTAIASLYINNGCYFYRIVDSIGYC